MSEIERAIEMFTKLIWSGALYESEVDTYNAAIKVLKLELEREKNPLTCDGCKESGLWDDEIEHGYNCPCMGCERNFPDRYEPKGEPNV